ncbi:hypothetical protein HZC09_05135 [Candidatus Micrarchaeota archaeon]|nr:hypothetical protein [Candidatus Micrarchaeota archaeon]
MKLSILVCCLFLLSAFAFAAEATDVQKAVEESIASGGGSSSTTTTIAEDDDFGPNFGPNGPGFGGPDDFGPDEGEPRGKKPVMEPPRGQPGLYDEFCLRKEEDIKQCKESAKFCDQIGQEQGPTWRVDTDEGVEEYRMTCPPDTTQIKKSCVTRMQREQERNFKDREEEIDINCEQRWLFEQPRFEMECEGGQRRMPEFCDKTKFISQCVERMPQDGGPQEWQQQPQQPQGEQQQQPQQQQWQPQQQMPQSRCKSEPQLPQGWYDNCQSSGGWAKKIQNKDGCVMNVECVYGEKPPEYQQTQQPQQQQGQQQNYPQQPRCPQIDENKKRDCMDGGGRWEIRSDQRGCQYVNCINQPQQQATSAPQQCPPEPTSQKDSCYRQGGQPKPFYNMQGCLERYDCNMPQQQQTPQPTPQSTSTTTCQPPSTRESDECTARMGRPTPRYDSNGCQTGYDCLPGTTPQCAPLNDATKAGCEAQGGVLRIMTDNGGCQFYNCDTTQRVQTASNPFTAYITGRMSASEMCEQEWQRNQPRFQADCERQKKQMGREMNICDEKAFIAQCRQEELGRMAKDQGRLNYDRICELEAKKMLRNMERFCKDTARGKEQCKKDTERNCQNINNELEKCRQLTGPDRVKEAIKRAVSNKCRFEKNRRKVDVRTIDISDVGGGEILPAMVAVSESISPDEARKLEDIVEKVESFNTISGLRIYAVMVKASSFNDLKSLPFVKDAKIDSIKRSIRAYEEKEGRLAGLDRAVTALEATTDMLPSEESRIVSYEAENLVEAKEKINELSHDKGVTYAIQQILGMKAEQEKKEAEELKAEATRLASTISRLKQLSEQVDDVALQGVLAEQIKDLESQQQSIQSKADAKGKGAAGLFSLFGLLG